MADKEKDALKEEEIEVVELFDDEGESMLFELLTTINEGGKDYLLLTAYIEDPNDVDEEVPADVFIMQEVETEGGDKMLEPLEDQNLMKRIFDKFKAESAEKFDFVEDNF